MICDLLDTKLNETSISLRPDVLGAQSLSLSYSFVANLISLCCVCRINNKDFQRTSKLLVCLFITHILAVAAITSTFIHSNIDDNTCAIFRIHAQIIAFLCICSSTLLTVISIDKCLLVVRGHFYLKWKRHFAFIITFVLRFSIIYTTMLHVFGRVLASKTSLFVSLMALATL